MSALHVATRLSESATLSAALSDVVGFAGLLALIALGFGAGTLV